MKFNLKYTKLGNQFFFISNLSEWHFSCRKNYNIEWIKNTGELLEEEKKGLNEFKKIISKYKFANYLGIYFIVNDDEIAWKELRKKIDVDDYQKIQNIFNVFEKRFKKIWKPKTLENNIKMFKKEMKRNCYIKIDEYLDNFFGSYNRKFKLNIYLLKHPVENWYLAGGANLGNKGITLECNKLIYPKHESVELALAVSYHELIHLVYQKKIEKILNNIHFLKNNKMNIINGRSLKEIIIEIVINSLFPKGYLANKYLHYQPYKNIENRIKRYEDSFNEFKKGNKINFNDLFYYVIYEINSLTKDYIENKKRIDKKYIEAILKYLEI